MARRTERRGGPINRLGQSIATLLTWTIGIAVVVAIIVVIIIL